MPPTPPKRTYWLELGALAAWGIGSVAALSADGRLPCGRTVWPDKFFESWVKAPGDSCDPVRSFLPNVDDEAAGQQASSPPARS